MATDSLLQIRNLQTFFLTSHGVIKAVDGVDLDIGSGETLGLAGESGSGKSVLARSILQLIQPPGQIVGGEIFFKGEDLLRKTDREMRRIRGGSIAMAFQDPLTTLNPVVRVGPQITEVVRLHGLRRDDAITIQKPDRRTARGKALNMMEAVRIPEPLRRYAQYPHQFSGGMRQRAVLATALACNPSLLIADEPTTALDVTVQAGILELLQELRHQHGTSILLITHDLGVIDHFCDRVAIMYAGRLVEGGLTRDVLSDPKHPYTEGLLACLPHVRTESTIQSIPGEVPDMLHVPEGCAFHPRCPRVMPVCPETEPPVLQVGEERWIRCHLFSDGVPEEEWKDG